MPPGRYRITATAPGLGVVSQTVTAPIANVRLQLSGSGKLTGEVAAIADGSLEVQLASCDGDIGLPHATRLVAVVAHHFEIDDVPACKLQMSASWRGKTGAAEPQVPNGGEATIALDLRELDPWANPPPDEIDLQTDNSQRDDSETAGSAAVPNDPM